MFVSISKASVRVIMRKIILTLFLALALVSCSSSGDECSSSLHVKNVRFVLNNGFVAKKAESQTGAVETASFVYVAVEEDHPIDYEQFPDTERPGYVLAGWSTDRHATVADFAPGYIVHDDITVFAVWVEANKSFYTVTLHENDDEGIVYFVRIIDSGTLGTFLPDIPDTPFMQFMGWNESRDGTGAGFTDSTPVNSDKDIYAVWQPITTSRTVKFYNTGSPYDTKTVTNGQALGNNMPPAPTKIGYDFAGWSTSAVDLVPDFYASTPVTQDLEVHAVWVPTGTVKLLVIFHSDRTSELYYRIVDEGTPLGSNMISLKSDSRYDFMGWNTNNNALVPNFFAQTPVMGNTDLYAVWKEKTIAHIVTFYDNTTVLTSKKVIHLDTVSPMPNDPYKPGYRFMGWTTQKGSNVVDFNASTAVKQSMSVYAVWAPIGGVKYRVSFYHNDGTDDFTTRDVFGGQTLGNSLPVLENTPFMKFAGWGDSANATTVYIDGSTVINMNMKAYAIWQPITTPRIVVFYESPSISTGIHIREVINAHTVSVPGSVSGPTGMPTAPSKFGYTFAGWTTKAKGEVSDFDGDYVVTRNMIVYPVWVQNTTYTVTFHPDDGSTITRVVEEGKTLGNDVPVLDNTDGKSFLGWSTVQNATTVNFGRNTVINSNMDVYPVWKEKICTITFMPNGSTASIQTRTVEAGGYLTDFPPDPVHQNSGIYFGGWNTMANGTGDPLTKNTQIFTSMTVFAQWGRGIYDFTEIDDMGGTYVLIANSPFTTAVQEPIGPFTGTLYGKNITTNKLGNFNCSNDHAGIFSIIDGGKVFDLDIMSSLNQAGPCKYVGLLAGEMKNNAYVENVNIYGSVRGDKAMYVGGIAGVVDSSTIKMSTHQAPIQASDYTGNSIAAAGSIAGQLKGDSAYLYRNRAYGNISINGSSEPTVMGGGIVGIIDGGTVNECYSDADVQAVNPAGEALTGGIAGEVKSGGRIYQCYVENVSRSTGSPVAISGGLVGRLGGELAESYANEETQSLSTSDAHAGGAVGIVGAGGEISRVAVMSGMSTSRVNAANGSIGRIAGTNSGNLVNNYANSAMTLNGGTVYGTAFDKNGGDTLLSDMQHESFYTSDNMGWDFSNTWIMGSPYPVLMFKNDRRY